jgi:hypothetical protein
MKFSVYQLRQFVSPSVRVARESKKLAQADKLDHGSSDTGSRRMSWWRAMFTSPIEVEENVKLDLLRTITFGVEAVVISTCALAAYQIATAHGGSIWACAPILTIAAMESLRVPVAMTIPKLKWMGRVVAIALLIGITPLTFEGMALAFEQFMHQRVVEVAAAQTKFDEAQVAVENASKAVEQRTAELDRLNQEVKDAEGHRVEIAKQRPTHDDLPPAEPCSTYAKKGGKLVLVKYDCSDKGIARSVAAANADARKTYDQQLQAAQDEVAKSRNALRGAEAAPAPDQQTSRTELKKAESALEEAMASSVMHRAAAAWFGIDVGNLSRQQFETFKKWAMYGLASATATVTMLAGFVSNMPRRDGKPTRVDQAIRAYFARRRKKLVRIVEKIKQAPPLKILEIKYVPFDPASGRVINRDGSVGEFVNTGSK